MYKIGKLRGHLLKLRLSLYLCWCPLGPTSHWESFASMTYPGHILSIGHLAHIGKLRPVGRVPGAYESDYRKAFNKAGRLFILRRVLRQQYRRWKEENRRNYDPRRREYLRYFNKKGRLFILRCVLKRQKEKNRHAHHVT